MIVTREFIMKNVLNLFMILMVLLGGTSCQRGEKVTDDRPTVALVMKTLNNPFFIDMQAGAERIADSMNVNLLVQAAEREIDVEKQMQIIENLIQIKVDVLCLTPSGTREIIPAIVKANKAGIPVIILDTRIDTVLLSESGGRIESFIGSDNFDGGLIAGNYIISRLSGSGNVAILEGIPGHETGDMRLAGFHKAIDPAPGIKVLSSQTANFERDQGFNVFQNMLQSYPEINALFSCNDMMALGAIEAIAAAGKTDEILVVGFDAVEDAREAIRQGRLAASVAQHPSEMGRSAVISARRLIDGKKIPGYIPVKIDLITGKNVGPGQK